MRHGGGCHCGSLRFELETEHALAALPLRACQCTFCRRHGATSASDPRGRLHLAVREPQHVRAYRFGLRTADFLVCGNCGIYVAAILAEDGRRWGIVNASTFDAAPLPQPPEPVDYSGEDAAQRRRRRRERWTPVVDADQRSTL